MDWLKNKLEDYSKNQKQIEIKQKSENISKKEAEKANLILGQKILIELVLPKLKEMKKHFIDFGFKCELKEVKAHIENLNTDMIGRVEMSIFTKQVIRPSIIKISPLLNAPNFHCEYFFSKNQIERTESLNYEGLDEQTFEIIIKKIVDELL